MSICHVILILVESQCQCIRPILHIVKYLHYYMIYYIGSKYIHVGKYTCILLVKVYSLLKKITYHRLPYTQHC